MKNSAIPISEFDYKLDQNQIASHPVSPRDSSKLLFYNKGITTDRNFKELPDLIPRKSILYFNDTKVINARLLFHKDSGARIEVLLLDPVEPLETSTAMAAQRHTIWQCMIGNLKKWKSDPLTLGITSYDGKNILLTANLIDRKRHWIEFKWDSNCSFAELLQSEGSLPIPPYLNRDPESRDTEDYQTIYSRVEGAVAAPTAGLHFTKDTFQLLSEKEIETHFITLHVGAGTFKPVEVENIKEHPIHQEEIIIRKETIENLLLSEQVIAVGTTSLRTLESIYWLGVQIANNRDNQYVKKETAYLCKPLSKKDSLEHLIRFLNQSKSESIAIKTELYIYPGYTFQICKGLITNFHLPKSSLLMLVSAFIGDDWKVVYDHALANNYRFLSFGDSSLLIPG